MFKKGDILRLINNEHMAAKVGSIAYAVYDASESMPGDYPGGGQKFVKVIWLQNGLDHGQSDGGYFITSFEKLRKGHTEFYLKQFLKQGTITNLDYLNNLYKKKSDE